MGLNTFFRSINILYFLKEDLFLIPIDHWVGIINKFFSDSLGEFI